jgi:hypothetical protein
MGRANRCKGGIVGAVAEKNWNNRDASIERCANANPGSIWVGNGLVDVGEVEVGGVLWVLLNVLNRH